MLALRVLAIVVTVALAARADEPDVRARDGAAVRVVPVDWAMLEDARPVPVGQGQVYLRALFADDAASWAVRRDLYALEHPFLLAGGSVGLAPHLALRLEGAQDLTSLHSGMLGGLAWSPLPESSAAQLTLGAGWVKELSGATGAWTGLALSSWAGSYRFAMNLRAYGVPTGLRTAALAGIARRIGPFDLGLEYAAEASRGAPVVHTVAPTGTYRTADERVRVQIAAPVPIGGRPAALPGRVSVGIGF